MNKIIYIDMKQSVELVGKSARLSDICDTYSSDNSLLSRINSIKLVNDNYEGKKAYVVTIIKVVEEINKIYPGIDIKNMGPSECVLNFKDGKQTSKKWEYVKVAIICIIMFFGAGFSIMTFNNDVSINNLFKKVCFLITGNEEHGQLLIESCYAIGIGLGLVIFYNHFGKKNITKDPTPIEVEMRKYEQDINQAVIDSNSRNDGKLEI